MTSNPLPPLLRRWLAGVLAVLIGLGPLATPAYAALIPLADEPLNVKNSAQPNIVLTVDDSTSMLFDFLPDYVASTYCRGGTGAMTAACGSVGAASDFTIIGGGKYASPGYVFEQYNSPYSSYTGTYDPSGPGAGCWSGTTPTCSPGIDPGPLPGRATFPAGPNAAWPNANQPYAYWELWPAPGHSAGLNALYYDPRLTYDPPVDSTGASYPSMDATNSSNWTSVPGDPWASTVTYVNLTTQVTDGLWCNSDWSLGSPTDPTQCRYNGEGGAAFGTVSAPDGQDYTYPWAPPGFVASASAGSSTLQAYAAQKVTLDANLKGTAINATNWNSTAQDQKFFYENENVIWCDPTSPSWPQTGPVATQTCTNLKSQTCSALTQTCNKTPGTCQGYSAPSCNGFNSGTCNNWQAPACNGNAGFCNNPPACNFGSCNNPKAQICNGTTQSCNSVSAQTCSGPLNQVCNLPGTQTCTSTVTYDPPGCNLLPPDPENPCTPSTNTTCTPNPGTCSIQTSKSCTQNSDCTPQPGLCNLTLTSCMSASDCSAEGRCSSDNQLCTQSSDCALLGGTCSRTPSKTCTKDSDCPSAGNCSNNAAKFCLSSTDCGQCNNPAGQVCTSVAQCTQGTCNQQTCANGTTVCSSGTDCTNAGVAGPCSVKSCQTNANCPAVLGGQCASGGALCGSSAQCPPTSGTCSSNFCPDGTTQCTKNSQCNGIGNGQCAPKTCSGSTQAAANLQCVQPGTCNNPPHAVCTANPGTCPEIMGTCQKDASVLCRSSSDCSSIGTCSFTSAACNSAVPCAAVPGQCSITLLGCTTPGTDLTNCPNVGKCSITQATCTSNAACPSLPGPLPPSAATCSTGGVGGVSTATLRNDAENNGVVCRRNNKSSGSYTSGPYTYPSGNFITPITNGTGPDACPSTDHYASTPRHYWKSEVQWCDHKVGAAGDKWLGFGTDQGGTCQAGKDSTHIYPRFFQFGAAAYVDNYGTAAFQRVDLVPLDKNGNANTFTHTWVDATGQTQTITRTYAEEMENYANWFAYYRTRIQAVKTVTSLSFTALDDQYRVGFHTLSNGATTPAGCGTKSDPATFVDIQNFDATQKSAWWQQLFGITIPLCLETPTLNAMARIGEYFKNGSSPQLAGATDPIKISCQKNWHMLFTDGFTNQAGLPTTTVADQDLTVPVLPEPVTGLTTGNAWPHPFQEDPNAGAANAASDYAMNYWVTDLRPDPTNTDPLATDNVPGTTKDPATWQHLNFAAMSLGTQGKLPVANQSVTENLLSAGTLQWPQPYPNVWKPDNSGVDDLWHAAINGRGRFVNAGTAAELRLGMGQILQDITNQAGSRAGVGLASSSISLTNHSVYRVTFQPGWAGTLTKIDIDVVTGAEISNIWEAAEQLHNMLTPSASDPTCATAGSCPWFDNRKIFTVNTDTNTAVPFLWDQISAAQLDSLSPGLPAVDQAIVAYLRGDPTNEGVSLGQFRVRATATFGENFLGDIVDSQAVYVGPPNAPYLDANDPGYSTFAAAQASRPSRVYVGANDGMLHAFDDANGQETWAFVPGDLYRPDNTGLGALAYQDGALPPFRHHFYVDSTPRIIDVNLGGGDDDWHSLLVGGLGKGGRSYYAIDVTDPASFDSEGNAAKHYLWTFTDPNMGCTYGRPMLAKTRAFGGKWLMVVAAGYNNGSDPSVCSPTGSGDGQGRIFFVDAATGKKLKEMTTPVGLDGIGGTSGTPSGLAHIAGYTEDFRNQLIDQIYGGDLYGNFWRFDVSDSDDSKWTVGEFAYLTDPGGNPQPVTTPPQIEVDLQNSIDRWVFIGTGRLLDDSDLTDPTIADQHQTFYAMRDGTTTTPNPLVPLTRADLVSLASVANGDVTGLTTKPTNGWYHDLPAGERIITPVQAALSVVAYAGTSPQDNPCLTGQPATLYVREFSLGESLLSDAGGNPVSGIGEVQGAVGLDIAIFADASGANSASGVDIRVAVTAGTTGDVVFQKIKPPAFLAAHRMSWRLLGQ